MGRGSYVPYGDSPHRLTYPKHSVRGGQSSLGRQGPETMDRNFDDDYMVNVGAHQKHWPVQTSTSNRIYPPQDPNSPYIVDRMYDWSLYDHDRNHGNDLATLRRKHAELDAKLQLRRLEGRPYDHTDRETAQAIVVLFEIEQNIARLEREGRNGGKLRDGRGDRTGSMDFNQNQSRAGGRAQQDTRGHRGSELPKRSNNQAAARQAGRHVDGSGYASRDEMTEYDIAPTTRDFSRLGVESRERGETPRPPRDHDFEDHAGEAFDYQPRGSLSGHHQPSAGHGRSSGRYPDHELGAQWRHQNSEDYATGDSNYQPRGSRHGRHIPPAGHCRSSGRFASHYSSR